MNINIYEYPSSLLPHPSTWFFLWRSSIIGPLTLSSCIQHTAQCDSVHCTVYCTVVYTVQYVNCQSLYSVQYSSQYKCTVQHMVLHCEVHCFPMHKRRPHLDHEMLLQTAIPIGSKLGMHGRILLFSTSAHIKAMLRKYPILYTTFSVHSSVLCSA